MLDETRVRVIQLANYSSPYPGSFVPMLRAAARWVAARGWSMEILLPPAAADTEWYPSLAETVDVDMLAPASVIQTARALRHRAETTPADVIIHTHFLTHDLAALVASVGIPRTHVVWHKHGSLRRRPIDVARSIVKYGVLARGVDAVVCVAPNVIDEMRHRGAPTRRLHHIINGIDISRFPPFTTQDRQVARSELELGDADRIALHFGWDWKRKGGDLFIRAIDRLRSSDERIVGITVGGGAPARAAAGDLTANGGVRVLEPRSDVRRLYAAADVFVAPSRSEGMPFAVIEALCLGVPVVATNIPAHRYLAHLPNMRVVAADDNTLAQSIASIFARDQQGAAARAAETRTWICSHLNLETWAERTGALYETILMKD